MCQKGPAGGTSPVTLSSLSPLSLSHLPSLALSPPSLSPCTDAPVHGVAVARVRVRDVELGVRDGVELLYRGEGCEGRAAVHHLLDTARGEERERERVG